MHLTPSLPGELPLAIGVLKANGCDVNLHGNEGFTLSNDISAVATATKLDLSNCDLRGEWTGGGVFQLIPRQV